MQLVVILFFIERKMRGFQFRFIFLLITILSFFLISTAREKNNNFFNDEVVEDYVEETPEEADDTNDFDFQPGGNSEDFEVDEFGNAHQQEFNPPLNQLSANFENNYDEPLELFWLDEQSNDALFHMGDIEPASSVGVNTFPGHRFLAKLKDSGVTAYPKLVSEIHFQSIESLSLLSLLSLFFTVS
jgi:hypothetical protein